MIWRDHVLNFGSKSATRVKKFRKKNWRGASRDSFFSKFCRPRSRSWETTLKHDLARLCVMLYTLTQWKFWENFENVGNFWEFWKILEFFWFFWTFQIIIFKVGGKLWRQEGYISIKFLGLKLRLCKKITSIRYEYYPPGYWLDLNFFNFKDTTISL